MNRPYIKRYNKNGELLNPIRVAYISQYPNRYERASKINQPNSKYIQFTLGTKVYTVKRNGNNRKQVNSRGRKTRAISK